MKRLLFGIIALSVFAGSSCILRADFLNLFFFGGASTPSAKISELYSENELKDAFEEPGEFLISSTSSGWHAGVNPTIELSDKTHLNLSIAFHSFPASDTKLIDPETGDYFPFYETKTSVVPIKAGIDYYLFDKFVGMYVKGTISYNHVSTSIQNLRKLYDEISAIRSTQEGSFGAGAAIGLMFDIPILTDLGVEVGYDRINIIGKASDEPSKDYLSISLMVGL